MQVYPGQPGDLEWFATSFVSGCKAELLDLIGMLLMCYNMISFEHTPTAAGIHTLDLLKQALALTMSSCQG